MKTWQSILSSIGMIFASIFIGKIPDTALQTAVGSSIAVVAAALAKKNSETDPQGNPLIKLDENNFISNTPVVRVPEYLKENK